MSPKNQLNFLIFDIPKAVTMFEHVGYMNWDLKLTVSLFKSLDEQYKVTTSFTIYANWEGVSTSKHNCFCILFIRPTTCFGHCGPSSGHKNIWGKLYSIRSLVVVDTLNFQRDLVVMRFIRIEQIICSTSKVDRVNSAYIFCTDVL